MKVINESLVDNAINEINNCKKSLPDINELKNSFDEIQNALDKLKKDSWRTENGKEQVLNMENILNDIDLQKILISLDKMKSANIKKETFYQ